MEKVQTELTVIESDQVEYLQLPAQSTLEDLYQHHRCPTILHSALHKVVWQCRVEYSMERVILSPNLAPSWLAALLALGAEISFSEPGMTGLLEEYLLRTGQRSQKIGAVLVPVNVAGRIWGIEEISRTPSDLPILLAAAVLDIDQDTIRQARIALTGVWPETARLAKAANLLIKKPLSDELIQQVADAIEQEVDPPENFLGGKRYRKTMAGVLTRRALQACAS